MPNFYKISILIFSTFSFLISEGQNFAIDGVFKIEFPLDHKIHIEGNYKDSLPEGKWSVYMHDYALSTRTDMEYKQGKLNGLFKEVLLENSNCLDSGYYVSNRKQGTWFHYYMRGGLKSYYTYRNDTLDGPFMDETATGNYKNGILDGKIDFQKGYDSPKASGYYINGIRNGEWSFEKNGERKVVQFVNDTFVGEYKTYLLKNYQFQTDTISEIGQYKQQRRDGYCVKYTYKAGENNERILYFKSEMNYKNGILHGPYKETFANGIVKEEFEYNNGEYSGFHISRQENGKVLEMHLRKKNYDSAEIYRYNGYLLKKYLNISSNLNSYEMRYDDSGKLIEKDTYYIQNGHRFLDHYRWKKGYVTEEYHFVDAKMSGRWFRIQEYEASYKNGVLIKKTGIGSPNKNETNAYRYFESDWSEIGDNTYAISAEPLALEFYYKNDNSKPLQEDLRYNKYTDSNTVKSIIKDLKKYDTLNLHGEVIYKVYLNAQGYLCSPILMKSFHPYYDKMVLGVIYFQHVSNRSMITPKWIEIRFKF